MLPKQLYPSDFIQDFIVFICDRDFHNMHLGIKKILLLRQKRPVESNNKIIGTQIVKRR